MAEQSLPTNKPPELENFLVPNTEISPIDSIAKSHELEPKIKTSQSDYTNPKSIPQILDDTFQADQVALERESLESKMAFSAENRHTSSGEVKQFAEIEDRVEKKFIVK